MKRKVGIIAALAVLAAVGAVVVFNYMQVMPVEVDIAREGTVARLITETGHFVPEVEKTIVSVHPMIIEEVAVEAGDTVTSGEMLVRGDVAQLEVERKSVQAEIDVLTGEVESLRQGLPVQLGGASSQLELAREELEEAEADLRTVQLLHEEGAASEQEVRTAQLRVFATQAQVHSAAAAVDQIQREIDLLPTRTRQIEVLANRLRAVGKQISEHSFTSPADLLVAEVLIEPGDVVSPGTPLLILQGADMRVEIDLLAQDAREVAPGQKANISGEALGEVQMTGSVHRIHPRAVQTISELGVSQRRVRAEIALDQTPEGVRSGYPADVEIVVAQRSGLIVDRDAVFALGGNDHVFIVLDGYAQLREISVDLRGDDEVLVSSGLEPGDAAVINPPGDLEDGARVRIQNEAQMGGTQ
ncbi:MAG: HlyD family efflux transporter periplasmic adaptor subunit [Bacillota bacterium]